MTPFAALAEIRKHPCDILIDTSQWPRIGALLARLARNQFVVGFRTPGQMRHLAFDAVVDHSAEQHEIENFRKLLSPLRVRAGSPPRLKPALLSGVPSGQLSSSYVLFHPWASGFPSE